MDRESKKRKTSPILNNDEEEHEEEEEEEDEEVKIEKFFALIRNVRELRDGYASSSSPDGRSKEKVSNGSIINNDDKNKKPRVEEENVSRREDLFMKANINAAAVASAKLQGGAAGKEAEVEEDLDLVKLSL